MKEANEANPLYKTLEDIVNKYGAPVEVGADGHIYYFKRQGNDEVCYKDVDRSVYNTLAETLERILNERRSQISEIRIYKENKDNYEAVVLLKDGYIELRVTPNNVVKLREHRGKIENAVEEGLTFEFRWLDCW